MFGTAHILYIVISLLVAVGSLIGLSFIKNEKYKKLTMILIAAVTYLLHISIVVVDSVNAGHLVVDVGLIVPVHFCNLCRYLLWIVPFVKNKSGWFFQCVACLLAFGGTIGCLSTIIYADSLVADPLMLEWATWKSLLSHSVMLIGCLYMFVGKYVKIRVMNAVHLAIGGGVTAVLGLVINSFYVAFGQPNPNSMYWVQPLADVPGLIAPTILAVATLLVFGIGAIYEWIKVPKGERWYDKLKRHKQE